MRHCAVCNIDCTGDLDRCPLCGSTLAGTASPSPFPIMPVQRVRKRAQRILAAVTTALLVSWVTLCMVLKLPWPIGVAASVALGLNYLFARNVIVHSPNVLRVIFRYFLVVMAMALLWFFATGDKIASSYVIPGISLAALLCDGVLLGIQGARMVSEYGKYLLYDIVFGAVPPALILTGTVAVPALAWSCAIAAVALLAALLVVARRSVTDEARRLFTA